MRTGLKRLPVNSGISLFLVLLIIMCLISFASLSLASALADMRLSEKYAQQVEWYYQARNEAQRDLAELNAGTAAFEGGALGQITRRYPAGDSLQLTVIFEAASSGIEEPSGTYRVISEKLESTAGYELDESLHVLQN